MELGQAHMVGVLDDEGVHVGDVHAGLDDGGAHQNGDLTGVHTGHDVAHLLLGHAAVGHGDGHVREALLELQRRLVDGVDAVVEVIHLPAPGQLPADGVPQDGVVLLQNVGLHRLAAQGGFLQHRHIPDARQGHVQGAGDGGGGEGQHVDALGHLLDALLVGHAEALLLVHHQQAQILELHVLLQNAVGADEQVHLAVFYLSQGLLQLAAGAEAAHHVHPDGIAGKPLRRAEIVLPGQHCGGHQDGRLLA